MHYYNLGTGAFRVGASFSELRGLIEEGYKALRDHGVSQDLCAIGSHIYARVFRQHRQQCGGDCAHGSLHDELLQRVLNELDESTAAMRRTRALSIADFTFGSTHSELHGFELNSMTPAIYPDPTIHLDPGIPERFNEWYPEEFLDQTRGKTSRLNGSEDVFAAQKR